MPNENQLNNLETGEQNSADLSKLFDYPSVGELFSDPRRFDEFCAKLAATRENLDRVVRYGSRDEAERATRAARAIETTLEFLNNLQQTRQNSAR